MSVEKIKQDFPIFNNQKNLVYFDSACMALRPQPVIDAVKNYYEQYPVCAERSIYRLGAELTDKIGKARSKVAKFINAQMACEIIFTRNTTEAINIIANGLDFNENDIVITTDKEHNSNLIPWINLAQQKKVIHKQIPSQADNNFDLNSYKKILDTGNVKLVAIVWTSNLDGTTAPAEEIIKLAHKAGALVLLDAAQTAGHTPINVSRLNVDFLAFSGHKLCGPAGIGALYIKAKYLNKIKPLLYGGGAIKKSTYKSFELADAPACFEAGLQNYSGILGFAKAVEYIEKIGFDFIKKQEEKINVFVSEKLLEIPKIKIIGPQDPKKRAGIVSFYFESQDVNGNGVAKILSDQYNICVRSGKHCVHSWFNKHGLKGSLRASFYFYNTIEEAEYFVQALKKIDLKEANAQQIETC